MINTDDKTNARKARYLTIVQLYENDIIDDVSASICLKGNLDPDNDDTFSDDSMLPLDNIERGLFMIELSTMGMMIIP